MEIGRRGALGILGAWLIVALAGCSSPKSEPASTPPSPTTPSATTGGKPDDKPIRAALVLDVGGPDDKSFNAAAVAGLDRAEKELGVEKRYLESQSDSDYQENLTTLANGGYDIVFAIGYKMHDALAAVAPQFPNVKFAIVDSDAPNLPNCAGLEFKEEQGSFLAGYLAASVTKTKIIGFVGGEQIPLIEKFEAGYKAGAKTADPNVRVVATYTGDWNDVNKGKQQAEQEFGNGADIIYHAAGKAGLGVIQAASEKGPGFYAIGVDQDQDGEAQGRVLTSMVKHTDNAVFDTIQRVKAGQFQPGTQLYDLKSDGVGLSEMKYTKQDIPADVLSRLDKITQLIKDGQIVPPTTLKEEETFQPPKI